MPTKDDFVAAAAKLQTAAQQVGDLTVAVEGAGASDILHGGALGRQVPERIVECAESAGTCQTLILDVEATCHERVAIIEAYEAELVIYDRAYSRYLQDCYFWAINDGAWAHPWPPTAPTPPPAWADVRRV